MPYNCAQLLSHICLFVTPWTVAHQASLSMECLRQEFWRGLSFPTPGDLSDPEIKPVSLALVGGFFTTEPLGKPLRTLHSNFKCFSFIGTNPLLTSTLQ